MLMWPAGGGLSRVGDGRRGDVSRRLVEEEGGCKLGAAPMSVWAGAVEGALPYMEDGKQLDASDRLAEEEGGWEGVGTTGAG
eukprot:1044091-Pelagomonas_calceolata.AAC.13